jgi:hypothetical protein
MQDGILDLTTYPIVLQATQLTRGGTNEATLFDTLQYL